MTTSDWFRETRNQLRSIESDISSGRNDFWNWPFLWPKGGQPIKSHATVTYIFFRLCSWRGLWRLEWGHQRRTYTKPHLSEGTWCLPLNDFHITVQLFITHNKHCYLFLGMKVREKTKLSFLDNVIKKVSSVKKISPQGLLTVE